MSPAQVTYWMVVLSVVWFVVFGVHTWWAWYLRNSKDKEDHGFHAGLGWWSQVIYALFAGLVALQLHILPGVFEWKFLGFLLVQAVCSAITVWWYMAKAAEWTPSMILPAIKGVIAFIWAVGVGGYLCSL